MPTTTDDVTTIRIAGHRAAPVIGDLLRRAYAEFADVFPWPDSWNQYAASVADVEGRWGTSTILVAERHGEVVGTVDYLAPGAGVYSHDQTTALIAPQDRPNVVMRPTWAAVRCLAVDPNRRGQGVAGALLGELVGRARHVGASLVFLHSIPIMASAIRLYESVGFERMPERDFRLVAGGGEAVLAFGLDLERA